MTIYLVFNVALIRDSRGAEIILHNYLANKDVLSDFVSLKTKPRREK